MIDNLLGNLEGLGGLIGLSPDQLKDMAATFQAKLGEGKDGMAAMMETAQAHGMDAEKIQGLLGALAGMGINAQDVMGKLNDVLDGKAEGGKGVEDLMGMAKNILG